MKNKRQVVKELLRNPELDKISIDLLKKRKALLLEHIEQEQKMETKRKIDATVHEVKEAGGDDSSTFWKVKKKLQGGKDNELAAIMDEKGIKHEGKEAVMDVYSRYFEELLKTKKGETEEIVQTVIKVRSRENGKIDTMQRPKRSNVVLIPWP